MLIFRRGSCPSDRRSCRRVSVACSRPPTAAVVPVRERWVIEKKEKERERECESLILIEKRSYRVMKILINYFSQALVLFSISFMKYFWH